MIIKINNNKRKKKKKKKRVNTLLMNQFVIRHIKQHHAGSRPHSLTHGLKYGVVVVMVGPLEKETELRRHAATTEKKKEESETYF